MRKKQNDVKRIIPSESSVIGVGPFPESVGSLSLPSDHVIPEEYRATLVTEDDVKSHNFQEKSSHLSSAVEILPYGKELTECSSSNVDSKNLAAPMEISTVNPSPVVAGRKRNSGSITDSLKPSPDLSAISGANVRTPGVLDLVKCTKCAEKFDPYNSDICVHPALLVMLCKKCLHQYQTKGELKRDPCTGKDAQCRWCLSFSDLIVCRNCPNAFCRRCIKRNLGRSEITRVQSLTGSDPWQCYICDPQPLNELQEECRKILNEVASYREIQRRRTSRKATLQSTPSSSSSKLATDSTVPSINNPNSSTKSTQQMIVAESSPVGDISSIYQEAAIALLQQMQRQQTSQLPAQHKSSNVKADVQSNRNHGPPPPKVQVMNLNNDLPTALPANVGQRSQSSGGALKWLYDPKQMNASNFNNILTVTLRTVATFYQDLRRLQVEVQRDNSTARRVDHINTFRNTFDSYYNSKLAKIPLSVGNQSSSSSASNMTHAARTSNGKGIVATSVPTTARYITGNQLLATTNSNSTKPVQILTPLAPSRARPPVTNLNKTQPQRLPIESSTNGLANKRCRTTRPSIATNNNALPNVQSETMNVEGRHGTITSDPTDLL